MRFLNNNTAVALISSYTERATAVFNNKYYQEAVIYYTKAIFLNDNLYGKGDPKLLNSRALVYVELGEFDNAISDFNKAIHLNNHTAVLYYNRAAVFLAQRKFSSALLDCHNAILLEPENIKHHILAAKLQRLLSPSNVETYDSIEAKHSNLKFEEVCSSLPPLLDLHEFNDETLANGSLAKSVDSNEQAYNADNSRHEHFLRKRTGYQPTFFNPATELFQVCPDQARAKSARSSNQSPKNLRFDM